MNDTPTRVDVNRAEQLTPEVTAAVHDIFEYHPWNDDQTNRGTAVRNALAQAFKVILSTVPPCPDRTVALRKLREARMDCNSAITHKGKY